MGTINGTSGDDVLQTTSPSGDRANGLGGNDFVAGASGNDLLYGGDGNDYLVGRGGVDTLHGDAGDDIILIEDNGDWSSGEWYDGGTGIDTLSIDGSVVDLSILKLTGIEIIDFVGGQRLSMSAAQLIQVAAIHAINTDVYLTTGGKVALAGKNVDGVASAHLAAADTVFDLTGMTETDVGGTFAVYGAAGKDTITGGKNNLNLLYGGANNDTLYGGGSEDNLFGGDGNDTIGGNFTGGAILGGAGDDLVYGGSVDQTLIYGGVGIDTLDFSKANAATLVDLDNGYVSLAGHGGSIYEFEKVIGSNYADVLIGDAGNNTLLGGNGDDTITGGAGNDIMDGGNGSDTVSYADAAAGIKLSLLYLSAQATGGAGTDTIKNFEHIVGSAFDDMLVGNDSSNRLTGGAGDDVLNGGLGNDTLYGGDGTDTASYGSATSGVSINLATAGPQTTLGAGTDTLVSIENVIGSAFNDTLKGSSGDNVLNGGAGNDTVSYAAATGGVTINLSLSTPQDTHSAGTDTLVSIEYVTGSAYDDVITGNAQRNYILGGTGNNIIDGASGDDTIISDRGNDVLYGGGGNDTLWGNAGSDTIVGGTGRDSIFLNDAKDNDLVVYKTLADSTVAAPDMIYDLYKGDKVDVSAIDADITTAGNQAFHLVSAFSGHAGEFTVSTNPGLNLTTVLFDVNGDSQADMAVQLTGSPGVDESFFVL